MPINNNMRYNNLKCAGYINMPFLGVDFFECPARIATGFDVVSHNAGDRTESSWAKCAESRHVHCSIPSTLAMLVRLLRFTPIRQRSPSHRRKTDGKHWER